MHETTCPLGRRVAPAGLGGLYRTLEQTAAVGAGNPDLIVEKTGCPATSKGVNDQRDEDLALSDRISPPVTVITLLVVFDSVIMAGVPLLLALSSIAPAIGLSMRLARHARLRGRDEPHPAPRPGGGDYTLFYVKLTRP